MHLANPARVNNNGSEEIVAYISGQASKANGHLTVQGLPTKQ